MTGYLLTLAFLFAFIAGHASRGWWDTGEWFYRYATTFFAIAAITCLAATS